MGLSDQECDQIEQTIQEQITHRLVGEAFSWLCENAIGIKFTAKTEGIGAMHIAFNVEKIKATMAITAQLLKNGQFQSDEFICAVRRLQAFPRICE